jgi:hypothetical protein
MDNAGRGVAPGVHARVPLAAREEEIAGEQRIQSARLWR